MPEIPGSLKPPRLSAAPGSPVLGQMYYDTTSSQLKWWNGSAWIVAAAGGATATIQFGSGAPAAGTGNNGDLYLDYTSLRFWGPKAAGAWPGAAFGRLMPLAPTYAQITAG